MDRLPLTPEDDAAIADWKVNNTPEALDPVQLGTNLVVDDHVQVDNAWSAVVLGGDGIAGTYSYIPEWGGLTLNIVLSDYITDRAGPNGETMPIVDPPHVEHRHAEVARRLLDAVDRLPGRQRAHALEVLRAHGAIDPEHCDS